MADSGTPFSIVTRGPLVVRDLDVLAEASSRVDVSVNISIPTLDERIWRTTEPHTSPPRQRLRALRMLVDAGINAGVGMAPILPGLADDPARLREVVLAAREAGARFLWWNVLNLRPGTKEHFMEHLARDWPEQLEAYRRLYADQAYLRGPQTAKLTATMNALRSQWIWEPRPHAEPSVHLRRAALPQPPAQLPLPLSA